MSRSMGVRHRKTFEDLGLLGTSPLQLVGCFPARIDRHVLAHLACALKKAVCLRQPAWQLGLAA